MEKKEKIIWSLVIASALILFTRAVSIYQGYDLQNIKLFYWVMLLVPCLLVYLHANFVLKFKKVLIFFALAAVFGYSAEYIGINYGLIFGGFYSYDDSFFKVLGIPFIIPAFWFIFSYISFSIVDSFFIWLGKKEPIITKKNIWLLVPLCIADGFIAVSIDFLMDPLQVRSGFWMWKDGGPYFNVPYGNFIGWVSIIALITFFFRLYETKNSERNKNVPKKIYLALVAHYFVFSGFYALIAPKYGMSKLSIMYTIPLIIGISNLFLYREMKQRSHSSGS